MQPFAAERTLETRNNRGMHRVVVCLLEIIGNRGYGGLLEEIEWGGRFCFGFCDIEMEMVR